MRDIYRRWRLLRMVRQRITAQKPLITGDHSDEASWIYQFTQLRTMTLRKYTADEATTVYIFAKSGEYIGLTPKKNKQVLGLSDKGFDHSSHTALFNDLAASIAKVSSLTAVIIAAFALYVSLTKK